MYQCEVCGREAESAPPIETHTVDLSDLFGLPAWALIRNVQYCVDRRCLAAAEELAQRDREGLAELVAEMRYRITASECTPSD